MDNDGDTSSWIMEYIFKDSLYADPFKVLVNCDLLLDTKNKIEKGLIGYSKNTEDFETYGFLQRYAYYNLCCIYNYLYP